MCLGKSHLLAPSTKGLTRHPSPRTEMPLSSWEPHRAQSRHQSDEDLSRPQRPGPSTATAGAMLARVVAETCTYEPIDLLGFSSLKLILTLLDATATCCSTIMWPLSQPGAIISFSFNFTYLELLNATRRAGGLCPLPVPTTCPGAQGHLSEAPGLPQTLLTQAKGPGHLKRGTLYFSNPAEAVPPLLRCLEPVLKTVGLFQIYTIFPQAQRSLPSYLSSGFWHLVIF